MALSKLSGDEQRILFTQLCNVLDPGVAVALSSVSNELRTATQPLLPQLRADHEVATALCRKVGLRSCKELREAKVVNCHYKGLTATDLELLGTLGSVLPALERLYLVEPGSTLGSVLPVFKVLSLNDRSGCAQPAPTAVQRLVASGVVREKKPFPRAIRQLTSRAAIHSTAGCHAARGCAARCGAARRRCGRVGRRSKSNGLGRTGRCLPARRRELREHLAVCKRLLVRDELRQWRPLPGDGLQVREGPVKWKHNGRGDGLPEELQPQR